MKLSNPPQDVHPRAAPRQLRAQGRATRQRVLEIAGGLFAEQGYGATSLRQIAAASRIDLATLKYHFGDKAALFAEVYRHGHHALLAVLLPLLDRLDQLSSTTALRAYLPQLVEHIYDYLQANRPFVRMTLYRLLEEPADVIDVEDRLQGEAIARVESVLQRLHERGIIRAVDTRALVVLLVTALPTWFVSVRSRPAWLGAAPDLLRPRFTAFFAGLLRQQLVPVDDY